MSHRKLTWSMTMCDKSLKISLRSTMDLTMCLTSVSRRSAFLVFSSSRRSSCACACVPPPPDKLNARSRLFSSLSTSQSRLSCESIVISVSKNILDVSSLVCISAMQYILSLRRQNTQHLQQEMYIHTHQDHPILCDINITRQSF